MQYNLEDFNNDITLKHDDCIIIDRQKYFISKINDEYFEIRNLLKVIHAYEIDDRAFALELNIQILNERGRIYVRTEDLNKIILYIQNLVFQKKKGIYNISIKCKNLTQKEFVYLQSYLESINHKINIIYD